MDNLTGSSRERINAIATRLVQEKMVTVKELSEETGLSRGTIRRDLNELEARGIAVRTHGGATLAQEIGGQFIYRSRADANYLAKSKIGELAARLIEDGDTVFLDASTTCLYLAKKLVEKEVTIITNSIQILFELMNFDNIRLICTGGIVRSKEMDFYGESVENLINSYCARKAFFSSTGFDFSYGATSSLEVEARIQRAMIRNAEMVVYLCDQTKFGRVCYNKVADVSELTYLITDGKLLPEWEQQIGKNLKILRCD